MSIGWSRCRHWALPLGLDEGRLTAHVLEAVDPASAILEFAEANHVDHIVIGARQNSLRRTLWSAVRRRSRRKPSLHGDRGPADPDGRG